jgi:arginyl-tRNA synthetase
MTNPWHQIEKKLEKSVAAALKKIDAKGRFENIIEIPPNPKMGDLACNVAFQLAKELKKNPKEIAEKLVSELELPEEVAAAKTIGPYINFFLNREIFAGKVVREALKKGYGKGEKKKKVVIVEFPSPNTNKPLHLGHMRNLALGESVSRIFDFNGFDVRRVNLNNDRGIHICKSMLAYQKWGKGKEPDKKSDHFVGDYYVLFNQKVKEDPGLEEDARDMLRKWEAKDKEVHALWKKMNSWAFKGFDETYKRFGAKKFDKVYMESETYEKGRGIVMDGLAKGVFYKDGTGAVLVDLEKEGLGEKVLLRADGTTVYITQDLYLANVKHEDFKYDKSVYVVAHEQDYHFDVLFKLLKILGYPFADGCYHLSYGMVYLPEGKMKSREGTVVDADDLIDEMNARAKEEIKQRNKEMPDKKIEDIADDIGVGAIKFYLLNYSAQKDFTFDPKQSISFEGETGPYVQYAAVRAERILEKAKDFKVGNLDLLADEKEYELVKHLAKFPDVVRIAGEDYKPSDVANYAYTLADRFSQFYNDVRVLQAESESLKNARLSLVKASKQVLENCLWLLGMEVPERM